MRDDPEAIALREAHQQFVRDVGEATDAMQTIETVLPPNWFGRLMLWLFARLRRAWAEEEEGLRFAARATYEDRE